MYMKETAIYHLMLPHRSAAKWGTTHAVSDDEKTLSRYSQETQIIVLGQYIMDLVIILCPRTIYRHNILPPPKYFMGGQNIMLHRLALVFNDKSGCYQV